MQRIVLISIKIIVTVAGINLILSKAVPTVSYANTQKAENCYMINAAGAVVNLSNLCPDSQRSQSKTPEVFTARIKRRYGGIPVIDVTFNGQQQFEMIVDTGATQTSITPAMADQLGLIPVDSQIVQVASGEAVRLPVGRVTSIEVSGAILGDTQVLIAPLPLLGQNFFSHYDVTIRQNVVEFHVR
ncbi:retroviral-like aspartic protease family protein [Gloeocapsopsis crepidinum LEGE 06123]|uniref:Retroviral-like aspartic protease family protein n=1 Tax=Gloeocapsopsis crepidinum LEGE 06123 TaxID=588587 RepID=A0ABR9UUU3_9CHRO|nr:retropepsin-like aspartic protease [Gloeocapsopsis crepidinum]MBE9192076.1 retroviral-like aspartic protease family protein [Gloeocapsopsis crepidinum LEGE 06123]